MNNKYTSVCVLYPIFVCFHIFGWSVLSLVVFCENSDFLHAIIFGNPFVIGVHRKTLP